MLYYDRTEIGEGIDVSISNNSRKCIIYHYWFFNHGFEFQDSIIIDIFIITIKGADYRCVISGISKHGKNYCSVVVAQTRRFLTAVQS